MTRKTIKSKNGIVFDNNNDVDQTFTVEPLPDEPILRKLLREPFITSN